MVRRGHLGIISRLVAAPREESRSAEGKTHEATAGQSQGGEKLALASAVPCPAQASPLKGSYGSTATKPISRLLPHGEMPCEEKPHGA